MMSAIKFAFTLLLASFSCSLAQITKRNASNPQPTNFQLGASSLCCDLTDDSDAFAQCLREASVDTKNAALAVADSGARPRLSVGLITEFKTDSQAAAFSFGVKEAYAEHNGYFVDIFEAPGKASADWEKVEYMYNALDDVDGWARNVDFLVWVGNDLAIVDAGMRIEATFNKFKKAIMLLSEGMHDQKIATDFLILRNSPRTVEFLEDWLRMGRGEELSFDDAAAFAKLTGGDEEEYDTLVKVLPSDALNTFFPAALNFKPHNQVLNLAGEHEMYKSRVFSEALHNMCRVHANRLAGVEPLETLPAQLDLTSGNLTKWGISVYRALYEDQLQVFVVQSSEGLNNAQVTGELSSSLRALTRLMEANDMAASAQKLREKTFKEMFMNFKRRRSLNVEEKERTGQQFPDWLEFMDHVTLVGSEYAQKIQEEDDRRVAMKVMLELANELESMDATRTNVQHRLMNIHMDIGMVNANSGENEESTKHFVEAVRIGRVLLSHKVIGEAEMFFPLSFCGDAFMKQARYKEALVMYGYALDVGKKSLASGDLMYQTMKLQYGIACYYDKRYRTAVSKIDEALDFFARNEIEMDDETYAIVTQAMNVRDAAKKAKYDPKVFDEGLKYEF